MPYLDGYQNRALLPGWVEDEQIADMTYPMRCLRCYQVHDAAKVTPTGRYSDCTVWRCPNCKAEIDDRPRPLGSAERVAIPQGHGTGGSNE